MTLRDLIAVSNPTERVIILYDGEEISTVMYRVSWHYKELVDKEVTHLGWADDTSSVIARIK